LPNRSRSFGLERRSDRTQARDCGYYENRNPEACEVRDDDSTALTQRSSCRNAAASFLHPSPAKSGKGIPSKRELRWEEEAGSNACKHSRPLRKPQS